MNASVLECQGGRRRPARAQGAGAGGLGRVASAITVDCWSQCRSLALAGLPCGNAAGYRCLAAALPSPQSTGSGRAWFNSLARGPGVMLETQA